MGDCVDWVFELASKISDAGGRLYLVGGAVRDFLMNRVPHDFDFCVTGIDIKDFQKLVPDAKARGKCFPVFDYHGCEFAFARQEVKRSTGHKGFEMICNKSISIIEDLKRRDITLNSIAIDVLSKEIIDPFNGKNDIDEKVIRATSDAFVEDPLRTYRVARFASQFGFKVDNYTIELMKKTRDELDFLSPERVFVELDKALKAQKPSLFFDTLKKADVLDIHFKEVFDLIGVIQPEEYHPEGDAYNHTMNVIDKMSIKTHVPYMIFAGLVHDLGKALTPIEKRPSHIGHEEAGVQLVNKLCDRLKLPNKYRKAGITACEEHMRAGIFYNMRIPKKVDFIERISKSALTLDGMEILANADNTKDTEIYFAQIGNEMMKKINAKLYPKDMDYNIIKEKLRLERINWLKGVLSNEL